ncbi:MAG: uracil-DNA glycosylase family protein [Acinetobacter sp.]|nr:uracil-DNA glycosylase family protein [Acinetobacter sp.]
MIECHPLAPFLAKNAQVLILGSFPPPKNRWKMDFYYPNYNNDFWRILGLIFFQDSDYFIDLTQKTFKQITIEQFLHDYGIAISDTAQQVRRLHGNASDQFLQIEQYQEIAYLLKQLPYCRHIMVTGDKACEALCHILQIDIPHKLKIGQSVALPTQGEAILQRGLTLHRVPSSSRAYPLPLVQKAAFYRQVFERVGILQGLEH